MFQPGWKAYNRYEACKDHHEILHVNCNDDKSPYIKLRYCQRPAIDATFMRTCKLLYLVCTPILYGQNKLNFPIGPTYGAVLNPPTWYGGEIGEHRPYPIKPQPDTWWEEVKAGIIQIQKHAPVTSLPGWIYYNTFLRFLYAVGPRNATHITSLTFSGIVKLHNCREERCQDISPDDYNQTARDGCPDDLIRALRLYTPFLQRFCKNLRKLTIYPLADPKYTGDDLAASLAEATQRLLERSIMRINTIEVLRVMKFEAHGDLNDEGYDPNKQQMDYGRDIPYEFAEPTIKAIEERTRERERQRVLEEERRTQNQKTALTSQKNSPLVKCGSCGENHLWVHYHNLCNRCGNFGHFGNECPSTPRER
jgi:hypothetical protein